MEDGNFCANLYPTRFDQVSTKCNEKRAVRKQSVCLRRGAACSGAFSAKCSYKQCTKESSFLREKKAMPLTRNR
jgi:hypothetical protein